MMFPIGLSIVAHLTEGRESEAGSRNFALAMMLMTSFGASVGGIGTPVGTPPNLIGIGMLNRIAGIQISFFQWMLLGVPLVILLFGFLVAYFYFTLLRGRDPGDRHVRSDRRGAAPARSAVRRRSATCSSPSASPWRCG